MGQKQEVIHEDVWANGPFSVNCILAFLRAKR